LELKNVSSFGEVAAEEDDVLEYFIPTYAVEDIKNKDVVLVLGRKGTGKTALVRYFTESESEVQSKALNLKSYPWTVHSRMRNSGSSEMEAYVSSWRYVIAIQACLIVLRSDEGMRSAHAGELRKFFDKNYGGVEFDLASVMQVQKVSFHDIKFEPTVLGNKLGSVSFKKTDENARFGIELDAVSDALLSELEIVCHKIQTQLIQMHFDELDLGLSSLGETDKQMLTGLVLAARYVRKQTKDAALSIAPVVYLRTDLWSELAFSDKNKISETQTISLAWNRESLLSVVNMRIRKQLDADLTWSDISEPDVMRGTQKKWDHILARTFLRPRDVIRFLNTILIEAKKRWALEEKESGKVEYLFSNDDVSAARDSYSGYLKAELDDEIMPHWQRWWDTAVQSIKALGKITFEKRKFIAEYQKRAGLDDLSAEVAIETLFKFSVVGYRQPLGGGGSAWTFRHIDQGAVWDSAVERFKIHQGLKEEAKLRE